MGQIQEKIYFLIKYENDNETVGEYITRQTKPELRPRTKTDKKCVGKYYKLSNNESKRYIHILSIIDEYMYEVLEISLIDDRYSVHICNFSSDIPLTSRMTERRFNKLYNAILGLKDRAINNDALIKDTTPIPYCYVRLNKQLQIKESELLTLDPSTKMIDIKSKIQAENRKQLDNLRYQMIQLRKTHKGKTYIYTEKHHDHTFIIADSIVDIYIRDTCVAYEIKRYMMIEYDNNQVFRFKLPTNNDIIFDLTDRKIIGYMPTYVWENEIKEVTKIIKEFKK